MPAERIGMRDAREVIRLKSSSVSTHDDRLAARPGALDGAGDVEAGGRRGPVLAPAGGHERQSAGGGALYPLPVRATRGFMASCAGGSSIFANGPLRSFG
jgi:hypothetical protein